MKNITLVILAAGEGKRFKPLITSKPLLPFLGKPLVSWLVDDFHKVGIRKLVIIINKKDHGRFAALFPQATLVVQKKPTGMADALLAAKSHLHGEIIVVNGGELLSPIAIKQFVKKISKRVQVLVSGLKTDHYLPGGYFKLKDNKPVAVIEKPGDGHQPSPYLNIVLHYFKNAPEFLATLAASISKHDDVYEVALSQLMAKNQVDLFVYQEYFGQIKYAHQVLDVTALMLAQRLKKANFIHPSAKVMKGAVVVGSYIGPNVIIGNNALVRDSIVEEGSVVGFGTEIARSYVGPASWFHCNYIGDSVIEGGGNMGSGARLANWRFDGQEIYLKTKSEKIATHKTKLGALVGWGVKFGINASIMPGVIIPSGSLIGSGEVVYK